MFKINNYKKIVFAVAVIIILGVLAGQGALATDLGGKTGSIMEKLRLTRGASGLPEQENLIDIVSLAIKGLLGIIAIVFFVLIIVAGFRWMASGGNEETITKSKKIIGSALIGLLIIMFSYALTSYIFSVLLVNR